MAEVKSGVNYEITADDKASAVADKASKNVQKSSKEAGEAFKGEFNPMSAVLAGISGNTQALAQQMLGLVSRMKSVHMTMMKFSLYAAFVMAVVKGVSVLVSKLKEARLEAGEIRLDRAEGAINQIKEDQERINEEFEEAIAKTDKICENILAEVSATEKLTNARREYNKALELSRAKTDEEKATIEHKYAKEAAADQSRFEKERIATERERLLAKIGKWQELLGENETSLAGYKRQAKDASKESAAAYGRLRSSSWLGLYWYGDDDAVQANRASYTYDNATKGIQMSTEAIEDLQDKIAKAKADLARLNKSEETLAYEEKKELLNADETLKAAKTAAEAKAKAEKEALAKIAAAKAKSEEDQAKRDAEDTKREQIKAHRAVMSERQKLLARLTAQESEAAARVAAAQSKVAEAWGWYRDKDKMAAQLKEEKAEAEAQKQFEKDFEDLKWRRDWRTAKDLSVDEEAVRRVALAREEETAAQKALAETAASTAKAAASLAEIEKVITQEG